MRKKKYSLTLLEVMIALSLAALLISALFQSFHKTLMAYHLGRKTEAKVMGTELMRERLFSLFSRISPSSDKKIPLQITQSPHYPGDLVYFSTDKNVDPDPDFCGTLNHYLFMKSTGELCLLTTQEKEKSREDILLKGMKSCVFSFFDPETTQWLSSWDDKKKPPAMLKITWTLEKGPAIKEECLFFFSEQNAPITYKTSS